MMDSMAKIPVKTISVYSKKCDKPPLGSFRGLSRASMMLEIEISKMMKPSKILFVVSLIKNSLARFSGPMQPRERPSHTYKVLARVILCISNFLCSCLFSIRINVRDLLLDFGIASLRSCSFTKKLNSPKAS